MIKGGKQRRNQSAIDMLATNIKRYRKAENLTITELANLVDVDYSQISRMERGLVNANISIVFDIAHALKIAPDMLLKATD